MTTTAQQGGKVTEAGTPIPDNADKLSQSELNRIGLFRCIRGKCRNIEDLPPIGSSPAPQDLVCKDHGRPPLTPVNAL